MGSVDVMIAVDLECGKSRHLLTECSGLSRALIEVCKACNSQTSILEQV